MRDETRDRVLLCPGKEACAPCGELGHRCGATVKIDDVPMCSFCENDEPCLRRIKAPDDMFAPEPCAAGPVRHIDPQSVETLPEPVVASAVKERPPEVSAAASVEHDDDFEESSEEEVEEVKTNDERHKCEYRGCDNMILGKRYCSIRCNNKELTQQRKDRLNGPERTTVVARIPLNPRPKSDSEPTPPTSLLMLKVTEQTLDKYLLALPVQRKLEIVQAEIEVV